MQGSFPMLLLVAKTGKFAPCWQFWSRLSRPGFLAGPGRESPGGIQYGNAAPQYPAGLCEVPAEIPALVRAPGRGFFVQPHVLLAPVGVVCDAHSKQGASANWLVPRTAAYNSRSGSNAH